MQNSPPLFLLILVLTGVVGLIAAIAGFRMRAASLSRRFTIAAIVPGLIMLMLFYSLALHMHQSLGGWPTALGERGFPGALVLHSNFALWYFVAMIWAGMFIWPAAFVICALVRRWRGLLFYLGTYALSCFVCSAAMMCAPSRFLLWWWD